MNDIENSTNDAVALAERASIPEPVVSDEPKNHARLLTAEEWAEVLPPFYYIKVNYDQWTRLEYEVAVKFILKNGTGWLYYDDKRFIFEKEDDYVLFRMWAENKPMHEDDTVVAVK